MDDGYTIRPGGAQEVLIYLRIYSRVANSLSTDSFPRSADTSPRLGSYTKREGNSSGRKLEE